MKMNLKGIQSTTAIVMLAACITPLPATARTQDENDRHAAGRGLEGTWSVKVTQHDCSTGAPLGVPFLSLLTFARGGTMTETTSNPMFSPAVRGPGHGVWQRLNRNGGQDGDDRHYQASSIALITLNGVLTQEQIIRQTIQMGSNPNLPQTTAASVEFYTPAGTLVRKGCATAQGTRF
jgi:hypothetical protein